MIALRIYISLIALKQRRPEAMSNYLSAVRRIQSADNLGKLERLERSLDNLYNLGLLTVSEFVKLDCLLMDQYCILEEA